MSVTTPFNYTTAFDFEVEFSPNATQIWVKRNWLPVVSSISIVYLIIIYTGQKYMKNRPPFDLRPLLTFWNFALAIFSIWGTVRVLPEFWYVNTTYGLKATLCLNNFMLKQPVLNLWSWLFVLSKVIELGDTVFIILRKQPLIFLHWYHHITAMFAIWYSYATVHSLGRWTGLMNFLVHSFMYSYYALRSMRYKIPRPIAMSITFMQILQMIVGLIMVSWSIMILFSGGSCGVTWSNSIICFLVYFTDFILFVHFFKKNYFKPPSTKKQV